MLDRIKNAPRFVVIILEDLRIVQSHLHLKLAVAALVTSLQIIYPEVDYTWQPRHPFAIAGVLVNL